MEYVNSTTCLSREAVLRISPQFSSFLPSFLLLLEMKCLLAEEILLLKMRTDVWNQNKWKLTAPTEQYLLMCAQKSPVRCCTQRELSGPMCLGSIASYHRFWECHAAHKYIKDAQKSCSKKSNLPLLNPVFLKFIWL